METNDDDNKNKPVATKKTITNETNLAIIDNFRILGGLVIG